MTVYLAIKANPPPLVEQGNDRMLYPDHVYTLGLISLASPQGNDRMLYPDHVYTLGHISLTSPPAFRNEQNSCLLVDHKFRPTLLIGREYGLRCVEH